MRPAAGCGRRGVTPHPSAVSACGWAAAGRSVLREPSGDRGRDAGSPWSNLVFIVTIARSGWYSGVVIECCVCGRPVSWSGRGRRPEVCGQRCRQRRHRARALPAALTSRARWCARDGKRPVTVSGRAASSTDPSTWTGYEAVAGQPNGIMLGGGLACWDLDQVIDADGRLSLDAREVLDRVGSSAIWVERSMSGRGLHVFVRGEEGTALVGAHVSYYSRARFIAVSGDRWRG